MSWWLDREGEKRSYWGGFLPGVQQCSCSLEENCIDMNYFCNCDADADTWCVTGTSFVLKPSNLLNQRRPRMSGVRTYLNPFSPRTRV